MNYPVFNTKEVRPWVKKFPLIARIAAIVCIPFMCIAALIAVIADGTLFIVTTLLPGFSEKVAYNLKLALYKWEDKE